VVEVVCGGVALSLSNLVRHHSLNPVLGTLFQSPDGIVSVDWVALGPANIAGFPVMLGVSRKLRFNVRLGTG
jgi:hypothetical protein